MNREDILERLDKMDMEAFATIDDSNMYHLVIVGGSGLVLLGMPLPTAASGRSSASATR